MLLQFWVTWIISGFGKFLCFCSFFPSWGSFMMLFFFLGSLNISGFEQFLMFLPSPFLYLDKFSDAHLIYFFFHREGQPIWPLQSFDEFQFDTEITLTHWLILITRNFHSMKPLIFELKLGFRIIWSDTYWILTHFQIYPPPYSFLTITHPGRPHMGWAMGLWSHSPW